MTLEFKARLQSTDEEVRREAVLALASRSDASTLAALGDALGDESWRVRKAAVSVFRDFPIKGVAARALINALGDPENAGTRSGAMEALTLIGKDGVPYLLEAIQDPDADVRKFVVDILGEIGDARAIEAVLPLTRDPIEVIRLAAVEALGAIGGPRAFDALLGLLRSADVSLQFSVLHALGRLGLPLPLDAVRPLFETKILRRALLDAMGQTKSPESIEFIVLGLQDQAKSSRQAAVRALHQVATDPTALDLARREIKKQLAGKDLSPFAEFLDANHLPTKKATVTLLSLLGSPEAIAVLVKAASDDSIELEVAEALARIGGSTPEVVTKVVRREAARMNDDVARTLEEAPVRAEAERALGPMGMEDFQTIRDLVAKEAGLYYDRELKYLVERRVQRRMEDLRLSDYSTYLKLLARDAGPGPQERRNLIALLSTNETYFFREDFQLKAFQEEILPALIEKKRKKGDRRVRVWSAGCSSGEEPYTIAILVKETKGIETVNVEILASDISDKMIEKAALALYSETSFRATPKPYLDRYFRKEGAKYRLADEIRKMVEFNHVNLMNCALEPGLGGLDVIFCRNVIIYFSPEAKLGVVGQFHRLLNPGGFLLLGHSESLMNVTSSFELLHLKHDLVYRKPEGGGT